MTCRAQRPRPSPGWRGPRAVTRRLAVLAAAVATQVSAQTPTASAFEVTEASIAELQAALSGGRLTSTQLVDAYIARIEAYDRAGPGLHSVLRLNPAARADAQALDRERAERGPRGPLHGIPVLLKDNFDTAGLPTTASSIALASVLPADDAFQVRRLREAGAIVLGKTNLHELASGITTISSLGGQTLNPYDPARNPGGSSGGTGAAIAASFAAIGWGTDTCGSIRIPAAHNNLFGLRPTKGLSSIDGIVPLSHTQDVAGPLARTVADLAAGLDATIGFDPADSATHAVRERALPRFAESLDASALRGARIGLAAALFPGDGDEAAIDTLMRAAIRAIEMAGAEIVEVPYDPVDSLVAGSGLIDHEFKFDLADYLAQTAGSFVRTLDDILRTGLYHASLEDRLRRRNAAAERETDASRAARVRRAALQQALRALLDEHRLDAIAYPTMRRSPARIGEPQAGSTCQLSANSGFPAISMPAGFTADGLPVGLELLARPFEDAALVALAYAFEQATRHRRPPATTPPLVAGRAPDPMRFTVVASAGRSPGTDMTEARGTFDFDVTRNTLAYDVTLQATDPFVVLAIVLIRTEAGAMNGPVIHRLGGPSVSRTAGEVRLSYVDRQALLEGRLALAVFTRDDPAGAARVRLLGGR